MRYIKNILFVYQSSINLRGYVLTCRYRLLQEARHFTKDDIEIICLVKHKTLHLNKLCAWLHYGDVLIPIRNPYSIRQFLLVPQIYRFSARINRNM